MSGALKPKSFKIDAVAGKKLDAICHYEDRPIGRQIARLIEAEFERLGLKLTEPSGQTQAA